MLDPNVSDDVQTPPPRPVGIRTKELQRNQLLNRLKNFSNGIDALSANQLEVRLELIEHNFHTFDLLQTQLEELDESQFQVDHRGSYNELYCDAKARTMDKIQAFKLEATGTVLSSTRMATTAVDSQRNRIQLPTLQLTKFSGQQRDWLDFFNVYSVMVHHNTDLLPVMKFQYLRSCLSDEAARLIESLEVNNENYQKAIDLLISRFDNKLYVFQSHIQNIFEIPKVIKPSVSALRNYIDSINANLRALQTFASKTEIADGIILHHAVLNLDVESQAKWEEEAALHWNSTTPSEDFRLPKWDDLVAYMERRCKSLEIYKGLHSSGNQTLNRSVVKHRSTPHSSFVIATTSESKCNLCSSIPGHIAFKCTQFVALSPSERFNLVKLNKLCLNCFRDSHVASTCPSPNRCQNCRAKHHTLLHREQGTNLTMSQPPNLNAASLSEQAHSDASTSLQVTQGDSEVILGTAAVHLCSANGATVMGRALLDSASQLHFITERMAQHLRLPRRKVTMEVNGIGSSTTNTHYMCSVIVKSHASGFETSIDAVIIASITSYQPQRHIQADWDIPSNIVLADPTFSKPGAVDVLIGAGLFYDLLCVGQIKGTNSFTLQKTQLGWIVSGHVMTGPTSTSSNSMRSISSPALSIGMEAPNHSYKSFVITSQEPTLDQMLERFWTLEHHQQNTLKSLSPEMMECERFFQETTTRCPKTNKFIVRLPFKKHPSTLGRSYNIALRRFEYLETKLNKNEGIRTEYCNFLREYSSLDHMAPISAPDVNITNYIPHHCVVKPDSSTTKLRVVFDASCVTSSGKSLNDFLAVGPTLQDDIFTILSRVRFHKYVLMADIAKMYRQVIVDSRDTRWQCILWREKATDPIETYQLKTVTYCTSCAPYLATKCLQQLAIENKESFPIGAAVTLKDFYVDNLMTGGASIEEAVEIKRQVIALLDRGGFPLRKFASNEEKIVADLPQDYMEAVVEVDDMQYIKTLGLRWSPADDSFSFTCTHSNKSSKVTKRAILSQVASLFDPLGLLNPAIVQCKMLLQELWSLKLHWDESVPQNIATQWQQLLYELSTLGQHKIPRYVHFSSHSEIHAFADASTKAYGACIYVVNRGCEIPSASLLCAKSRVAPLKQISLPRLELCAAHLLSELLESVLKTLPSNPFEIYCWSDSTITLDWIAGEPSRWVSFVANRVTKIQQLTSQFNWRHVPSAQNPADLLSRGAGAHDIIENSLWFNGPKFLMSDKSVWPTEHVHNATTVCELRKSKTALVTTKGSQLILDQKYINDYNKILRVFAYVRRFINVKTGKEHNVGNITCQELETALLTCCRIIQQADFASEFKKLSSNRPLENGSKLLQLTPFLHDNLIRVGGRLKNSTLPYETMHPIVLPSSHPFVSTIIENAHRKNLHAGALTLHNILRDKFWIINARNTIKKVIHKCLICYRYRPITENQIMGYLPKCRVEPSHPFEVVGVDYCGPFYITQGIRGRSPIKVYVAVFICFATKAVHLECVADLTSAAFIAALNRFVARRGRCRVIHSDNATNFVGANKELRELLAAFASQQHMDLVQQMCQKEGITWNFIPPRSPHFGGLWESAVKQAKHYLRRTIGLCVLTYDELETVCCQAEAIINSRPLTPLSSDPNDLRPLTPAHFLVGRTLTAIAQPSSMKDNPCLLKRYQRIQWIHQQFWDRWHREYLKGLQQRVKWWSARPNLQEGDMVLLQDDGCPPLKWPIGRIIQVIPGPDKQVRVVSVKTADGIFKRAVTKICKLPISTDVDNESN